MFYLVLPHYTLPLLHAGSGSTVRVTLVSGLRTICLLLDTYLAV